MTSNVAGTPRISPVITTVPAATPVTTPLVLTVASASLPEDHAISPWYSLDEIKQTLNTPEWTFTSDQFKTF